MNTPAALLGSLLLASPAAASDFCIIPNTPVPDNTSQIAIPVFVVASPNETIATISLDLIMTHDWVGDLHIQLRSPSGTTITLLDRPGIPSTGFPGPFGCGGRDILCTFTDDASTPAESVCSTTATPVIAGEVIPSMPLNAFIAEPASGFWELLVSDQSAYDAGTVQQVCLSITTSTACPADLNNDAALDFFDISAFLTAYANMDPIADFSPDGLFDFFDISAFLTAYGAGCP